MASLPDVKILPRRFGGVEFRLGRGEPKIVLADARAAAAGTFVMEAGCILPPLLRPKKGEKVETLIGRLKALDFNES
jgi:hypothetical protein